MNDITKSHFMQQFKWLEVNSSPAESTDCNILLQPFMLRTTAGDDEKSNGILLQGQAVPAPYKRFRVARRGEPRVHPVFPDRFPDARPEP